MDEMKDKGPSGPGPSSITSVVGSSSELGLNAVGPFANVAWPYSHVITALTDAGLEIVPTEEHS
jgi:hypothetical protein